MLCLSGEYCVSMLCSLVRLLVLLMVVGEYGWLGSLLLGGGSRFGAWFDGRFVLVLFCLVFSSLVCAVP
jgi:hypothetical protein